MDALTIGQAAHALGITPQRVSQLLAAGALEGPEPPPGQRAPRDAPRVWLESLEAEQQRRSAIPAQSKPQRRTYDDPDALRDDVFRLKAALDAARDQLARQREQTRRVTRLLADTVAALQEQQELAQEADRITEAYSTLATTHLAPDTPPPSAS